VNTTLNHAVWFCIAATLAFLPASAEAARSFTVTQVTSPAEFVMGGAQPITFTIDNTSTAGETITQVQFNVTGTYTYFPPQTVSVPNWNCTLSRAAGGNYRRITCAATAAAYRIAPGASLDFTFNIINNPTNSSRDRTDQLSSVVASFRVGARTRTSTLTNRGSWTWKSLYMTLVPSSLSVGSGCQVTLVMTVTNRSTSNNLSISPVPSPRPTAVTTGGASVNNPAPTPASLPLNAGATGPISWDYTLSGPAGGTVRFTACASTTGSCTTVSGTSRTSPSITSATVTIASGLSCGLSAAITNNPACLFPGNTATFTMTVTNTTGNTVYNVSPSVLTPVVTGSASIGAWSGPAPASIASIANNGTGVFTWTAPVTGNPNDQYSVSGYATANGPIQSATVASNVQDVDGYTAVVGAAVAGSTNDELTWTITNFGCSNINSVSIAVPAGWTFAGDAYALVNNTAGTEVDSWTWASSSGSVTFTAPNAADRIPLLPSPNTGAFSLLFDETTPTPGTAVFTITVTDDTTPTPATLSIPTSVAVAPFDSSPGGPNAAGTGLWHEEVR
jgi:hypothetical protein